MTSVSSKLQECKLKQGRQRNKGATGKERQTPCVLCDMQNQNLNICTYVYTKAGGLFDEQRESLRGRTNGRKVICAKFKVGKCDETHDYYIT